MNLRVRLGVVSLVLAALMFALASPPAAAATPQEVDAAIKKAKAFLRSQQKKDGSWPENLEGTQFGGHTAIATYALLAGGDSPQDEHIQRAIRWLGNAKITGIYALGLRAQVWPYLKLNNDVRTAIIRDAELLLKSHDKYGRWGYTTSRGGEHNSPTQYGVLGLWACQRAGYEVPSKFWAASEQGWWACQSPHDGGWEYHSVVPENGKSTPTMTAAGLASLFVAQDYLRSNEGIKCNGNVTNPRIEAGMKWMSDNFNPGSTNGYLLYGIERIGVASGYKYFGKHDWYAAGSTALVKAQAKNGSWDTHGPIPGTSFGIFFLTRGRAPVVMNKLQYEFEAPEGKKKRTSKDVANWNQRPRDAANAVRWIGAHMERDLNWQIVNLKVGAGDLLDAPILYIAGDQQLRLADEDKQKLKSYVEQGGMILGQADCGKADFAKSFRALGQELFPGYDFRLLPPSHAVFNVQYNAAKWKGKIDVEGLSNGVRELMLLIPKEDVSRSWQTQATSNKDHHFALASNIFLYAVDKSNLRYKGETYVLKPDPKVKPKRTIKLARIRYGGNWDPEPGGWRRLGTYLLNEHKLELKVDTVQLGNPDADADSSGDVAAMDSASPAQKKNREAKARSAARDKKSGAPGGGSRGSSPPPAARSLKGYDVAHLTGTTAFKLDDAARADIRAFIDAGGTLLVDAAGGSTAFAEAVEKEFSQIFKDDAGQLSETLKVDHAVYTVPASKVTDVAYRNFAREKLGKALRAPRLRAITLDKKRAAVVYSKEDLSAGLVGQPVDGVFGYDPRTATQLAANVILYATGEGKTPPSTQPATKPTTKPATKPAATAASK